MKPKVSEARDTTTAAYWTIMFFNLLELNSNTKASAASIGPLIDSDCYVAISPRVASEIP